MKALVVVLITGICASLSVVLIGISLLLLSMEVQEQRRQIDQLYVVIPSLIQRGVAPDQWIFYDYEKLPEGKYKMYFADNRIGSAILVYLDPDSTKRRENELRCMHTSRIPKDILNEWTIGEVRALPLAKE